MTNNNYQYTFTSSKKSEVVFAHLIDPNNWWVRLYGETIKGKSKDIGDEFSFSAGDGMHYSNQKLIELVPSEEIVWLVTESNLSFLNKTDEWAGTKISFSIKTSDGDTKVTFEHIGLIPSIECYDSCSSAWTQYMRNLQLFFQG
jgi:Activator of Hsp90 ATPase homolog 1-like protein